MTKRDNKAPGHPEGLPPEAHSIEQDGHGEQDPVGEQAQDVAEDAMRDDSHITSPLESIKPAPGGFDPAPGSEPDLIDEMRRMEGEGRIDMSAFAGEPNHDDEPETYGGETTDDDDADWITADGESLAEAEEERLEDDGLLDDEEE